MSLEYIIIIYIVPKLHNENSHITNAYHLLIMPINVDCTNIIKTDLQNRVLRSNLMRFERIFIKFSLIIVVSNDTKRKEIKKTIIGILKF